MLKQHGFENNADNWKYCSQTNLTWKECPYAQFDKKNDIILAVHNPSGMELQHIELPIPHDQYVLSCLKNNTETTPDYHITRYSKTHYILRFIARVQPGEICLFKLSP